MKNNDKNLEKLFFKNIESWLYEEKIDHLKAMQDFGFNIHQPIAEIIYNHHYEIVQFKIKNSFTQKHTHANMGILGTYLYLKNKHKKPVSKSFLQFLLNSGEEWIKGQPFNSLNQLFLQPKMTIWFEEFLQDFKLNKNALICLKMAIESQNKDSLYPIKTNFPTLEDYVIQVKHYQTLIDNQIIKMNLQQKLNKANSEKFFKNRI